MNSIFYTIGVVVVVGVVWILVGVLSGRIEKQWKHLKVQILIWSDECRLC